MTYTPTIRVGAYMTAEQEDNGDLRTKRWIILDRHGGALGRVRWYNGWRQYVFTPSQTTDPVFNPDCLEEIARFARERTESQRREASARRYADEFHRTHDVYELEPKR